MDFLDHLVDGTCGEVGPALKFIRELDAAEDPIMIKTSNTTSKKPQSNEKEASTESQFATTSNQNQCIHVKRRADEKLSTPQFASDDQANGIQERSENELQSDGTTTVLNIEQFFLSDHFAQHPESYLEYCIPQALHQELLSAFEKLHDLSSESRSAKEHEESHGHTDDCTPSSGPNYLMEIQNPTWETALFCSLNSTIEKFKNRTSGIENLITEYSSGFDRSVQELKMEYPFTTTKKTEKKPDYFDEAVRLSRNAKFVEAISYLEQSLRQNSKNTDAWTLLAFSNYMCQNDSLCISACKAFLKEVQDDSVSCNLVLLLFATCLSNESDFPAAQAVLLKWIISYWDISNDIQSGLSQSAGNVDFLLGLCESRLREIPDDGPLHWAMAILEFGVENYSSAGRHFEAVLKRNPGSPCVLNQIGACLQNLKKYEEAIHLQEEALKICPDFCRALYNKALTQCSMGKTERSLQTIATAIENLDRNISGYSDQFWYLAAQIGPRLNHKTPDNHSSRLKIMSAILGRNLNDFKQLVESRI